MIDKLQTGKRISVLRKKSGMSQADLAEKLNITTQAVSKWECGQTLPDVDSLIELSWIFDVSINNLLEDSENFSHCVNDQLVKLPEVAEALLNDKNEKKILRSIVPYFTSSEITQIARQSATGFFKASCCINALSDNKNKSVTIELSQLSERTLRELAPFISEAANIAVSDIPKEIKRIADYMICPICKSRLELSKEKGNLVFTCQNDHKAKVVDGVICFDVREIPGEQWSLSIRNYDQYLEWQNTPVNPNYKRGKISGDIVWEKLHSIKPKVILDIASGMGTGIGHFIKQIDWPCMIILTDLSYRILSWNKIYFETVKANPYVELVYICCDCANIPIKSESIEVVLSNAGFESMQKKRMNGFQEGYRILKRGGSSIYNMSIVEDKTSANSKKWMDLMHAVGVFDDKQLAEQLIEISEWKEICGKCGYRETWEEKLYGELPAPRNDVFPFKNELLQWTCSYVCVSRK